MESNVSGCLLSSNAGLVSLQRRSSIHAEALSSSGGDPRRVWLILRLHSSVEHDVADEHDEIKDVGGDDRDCGRATLRYRPVTFYLASGRKEQGHRSRSFSSQGR